MSLPGLAAAHRRHCSSCWTAALQRIAERSAGRWQVNEWLKKAVLLYFRTHDNQAIDAGYTRFYDKVPLKYAQTRRGGLRRRGRRAWCRTPWCAAAPTSHPTRC